MRVPGRGIDEYRVLKFDIGETRAPARGGFRCGRSEGTPAGGLSQPPAVVARGLKRRISLRDRSLSPTRLPAV